jgi:Protein of unknown function (DUF3108)
MRLNILRSTFLIVFAAFAAASASAQTSAPDGSVPTAKNRPIARDFVGEKLTYEGRVSKFKVGMSIADLTFTGTQGATENELEIKSYAKSKGTMLKLFRVSFLQEYTSVVDLSNFRITNTTKRDVQKERVRESEALFDYGAKRVTYVETDPKDANRPPRRIASEITDPMNDMVSAIYALRMSDLAVGKKFEILVSDSGLVYKVPVAVTKREKLGTDIGTVWCYRVEPEIFGSGRLIERKGKMILWITEDQRRLPVKAAVDMDIGKAEIKIKSVTSVPTQ